MNFRLPAYYALPLLAAFLPTGCGEDATGSKTKTCAEIGDEATASAANQNEPVFKVLHPNGGESIKVGDSLKVRLASNSQGTSAQAFLIVTTGAAVKRLRLPGTPITQSFNPRLTCEYSFAVPESLMEAGKNYNLVSDDVKVRLEAYQQGELFGDFSDASFRITR